MRLSSKIGLVCFSVLLPLSACSKRERQYGGENSAGSGGLDGGGADAGGTTTVGGTSGKGGASVVKGSAGGTGGGRTTATVGGTSSTVAATGGTSASGGTGAEGGTSASGGATASGGTTSTGTTSTGTTSTGGTSTVVTTVNPCATNPCLNGGTCIASGTAYTCKCAGAYFGNQCEELHFEGLSAGCDAQGISADGKVVVGSIAAADRGVPARWTKATGFKALQSLSDVIDQGYAAAASADGSVIVGKANLGSGGGGAFRWNATEGLVSLGLGVVSEARGVSSTGAIIVGAMSGTESSPLMHLFRWTAAGGVKDLVALGASYSIAGVSADGTTVAGGYVPVASAYSLAPFRWTQNSGLLRLGTESGGYANAISSNGMTIVGALNGAFRYTTASGFAYLSLGNLTGASANAVSEDGSVIGGGSNQGPWIWDANKGARLLLDVLTPLGVDLTNWGSMTVRAMSADGKVFAGTGYQGGTYTCWVARL
jgi:hypothetical protein